MLKFVALFAIFLFGRVRPDCERPKYLTENEKECLEITTTVFERLGASATGILNMAKKKLGIDVEEEPLKCSYYLCLLHNIFMVTEAGALDSVAIPQWIDSHVPPEVADEFKRHAVECVEIANKVADVPNCQKSTDFVKCLSLFNSCPIFKFP